MRNWCELFADVRLPGFINDQGRLMLSGISAAKEKAVEAAIVEAGWRVVWRRCDRGWIALEVRSLTDRAP